MRNRKSNSETLTKGVPHVMNKTQTKQVLQEKSTNNRENGKGLQIASSTSKWSMFIATSKGETDSEEDSDEVYIQTLNNKNSTVSNLHSDGLLSSSDKSTFVGVQNQPQSSLSVHQIASRQHHEDVSLFGTEDDLDDIISQM